MVEISLRLETVNGSRLLYDRNQSANGNCSWLKSAIRQKSVCEWELFLVRGGYMMEISLRMETVLGSRLLYDGNQSANEYCSLFKAAIWQKSV